MENAIAAGLITVGLGIIASGGLVCFGLIHLSLSIRGLLGTLGDDESP